MTDKEREQLQDDFVYHIVDGMDHKTVFAMALEYLSKSLDSYSDEELITEVKEYYPELLENEQESERNRS